MAGPKLITFQVLVEISNFSQIFFLKLGLTPEILMGLNMSSVHDDGTGNAQRCGNIVTMLSLDGSDSTLLQCYHNVDKECYISSL